MNFPSGFMYRRESDGKFYSKHRVKPNSEPDRRGGYPSVATFTMLLSTASIHCAATISPEFCADLSKECGPCSIVSPQDFLRDYDVGNDYKIVKRKTPRTREEIAALVPKGKG